ncbi:hypothetical protein M0G43_06650 [Subsaxibacter sp. CAU 1640]|uniref:hypothetical protein n=1 Tax=Subsaxibacter sp. CAU 1640 TaxID=2933271 RepID=UPI002003004A|nr:hypothetical protein [Subsaxibacter sp. CAU 1640]MCK7590245.1 hypothetical protein [Subsaxibacter sp. CAU 1640]
MKKVIIVLFISFLGTSTFAQNPGTNWLLSVGVNTTANFGTRNPFEDLNDNTGRFAFRQPLAVGIERKWTKYLYIEQDVSLNGFKENEYIDRGRPDKDLFYFSTNTTLKYYFDDHIFRNSDWLNLYAGAGVGIFNMEELNTSVNIVFGTVVWVSDNVGIRLGTMGKFAFEADSRQYDNNHYQFFLQGVFKL